MAKGVFSRMADIVKANINELLDRAEEPDKMIRQMVREMEEAVSKATASVGTALANQKRLERQHAEKVGQGEEWQRRAERAVEGGDDELARRALERKAVFQNMRDELGAALEESRRTVVQLKTQLGELKVKLEEARAREGALVARHRAAQARKQMAQSMSGLGSGAFSSFERFEQRIESSEAEAEAFEEMASDKDDIEKQIRQLDTGKQVESELAQLKARVTKKTV
jgi:phage shock protein A